MAQEKTYEDIIRMLAENYKQLEQSIAAQLLMEVSNHPYTGGSFREGVWKSLFEMIIPKKYRIEQNVFIIDSYGHKSKEVDLAIFDELYTPYIFNYGNIKFIPIEAVAAVVECKSRSIDEETLLEWLGSIKNLVTSMDSVARMATGMIDNNSNKAGANGTTQTATRPILILCSLELESKKLEERVRDQFDIHLVACEETERNRRRIRKYIKEKKRDLKAWNESLNHDRQSEEWSQDKMADEKVKRDGKMDTREIPGRDKILEELEVKQPDEEHKEEENVLLSLIFQLNQLLMVINNPMLFPHRAYAKRFTEILNSDRKEGEKDEP